MPDLRKYYEKPPKYFEPPFESRPRTESRYKAKSPKRIKYTLPIPQPPRKPKTTKSKNIKRKLPLGKSNMTDDTISTCWNSSEIQHGGEEGA